MQLSLVGGNNKIATNSKIQSNKIKKRVKSNGCYSVVNGSVALILGLSLIMLQATIMSFIAEILLDLRSDTFIFKMWQKCPVKVPYVYTFFNWTNHQDFFNKSAKIKLEEIGPYAYFQDTQKVDVVRNNNNNTITFKQMRTYHYDNDFSNNGNLSDRLTTINYLTLVGGYLIKDSNDAMKDLFSEYLSMFDPYYYFDTIIDDQILKGFTNLLLEVSNLFDFILPDFPHIDGFGWAKFRTGDPDYEGVFNIANGVNRQFDVLNWNYHDSSPYYDEPCNQIKGSIGDVFSYPLNKEFVTVFIADACRYVTVYFEKEVIIDGIMGYKYSFTKLSSDNGTLNPANKCFCVGDCAPSGAIGVTSCKFKLNGYISLPHFHDADPIYSEPFEGLNPNKEKHESYIVIEPNSLLCLEVKVAAQMNILMYPVEGISVFENYPKLYFPLFWMESHVQVPEDIKKYLRIYLYIPYVIIVIAVILISVGIFGICYGLYKLKVFRLLQVSSDKYPDFIENVPLNKK